MVYILRKTFLDVNKKVHIVFVFTFEIIENVMNL